MIAARGVPTQRRMQRSLRFLLACLALGAPGCSSTSGLPDRTELLFDLVVAEGVEFDPEWITVSFDAGGVSRTVNGTEFVGPVPGRSVTETFVLPSEGEVQIRIEIELEGDLIGEAAFNLALSQNRRWAVRTWLDPAPPVPCNGCSPLELPLADDALGLDTFWILRFRSQIVGGGIN